MLRRIKQREYDEHRERVRLMTCAIDTKPPRSMDKMNRPNIKRQMEEKQRRAVIALDNKLLKDAMKRHDIRNKGQVGLAEQDASDLLRVKDNMDRFHKIAREHKNHVIEKQNEILAGRILRHRKTFKSQYSQDHKLMKPPQPPMRPKIQIPSMKLDDHMSPKKKSKPRNVTYLEGDARPATEQHGRNVRKLKPMPTSKSQIHFERILHDDDATDTSSLRINVLNPEHQTFSSFDMASEVTSLSQEDLQAETQKLRELWLHLI